MKICNDQKQAKSEPLRLRDVKPGEVFSFVEGLTKTPRLKLEGQKWTDFTGRAYRGHLGSDGVVLYPDACVTLGKPVTERTE